MELEKIMLSEISQAQKDKYCISYSNKKFYLTERQCYQRLWNVNGRRKMVVKGSKFSVRVKKNFNDIVHDVMTIVSKNV